MNRCLLLYILIILLILTLILISIIHEKRRKKEYYLPQELINSINSYEKTFEDLLKKYTDRCNEYYSICVNKGLDNIFERDFIRSELSFRNYLKSIKDSENYTKYLATLALAIQNLNQKITLLNDSTNEYFLIGIKNLKEFLDKFEQENSLRLQEILLGLNINKKELNNKYEIVNDLPYFNLKLLEDLYQTLENIYREVPK